jgi:hypothetical protein
MIMKACLVAVLVPAIFRQFHSRSKEASSQSAAFIFVMTAIWGLHMPDKVWEKDEKFKAWLPFKEFFQDEHCRMNHIIRLDQGAAVLLCVENAGVGNAYGPISFCRPAVCLLGSNSSGDCRNPAV